MTKRKQIWKWKGGRLCRGKVSLTVPQAFEAIPNNPDIKRACHGILVTPSNWASKQYELYRN